MARESAKLRREGDPERERALNRARVARYRAKHPEKVRAYEIKSKYGITRDAYDSLLSAQGERCAVCRCDFASLPKHQIHVDHCHNTEVVRGILCHACNTLLGRCGDNEQAVIETLTSLLEYLRR